MMAEKVNLTEIQGEALASLWRAHRKRGPQGMGCVTVKASSEGWGRSPDAFKMAFDGLVDKGLAENVGRGRFCITNKGWRVEV